MPYIQISWREGDPSPLFLLGHCSITSAAQRALDAADVSPSSLLHRHASGDWGIGSEWMLQANTDAVKSGICAHVIQSQFHLENGPDVMIMTSMDRTHSRLLLVLEYQYRKVTALEGYAKWAMTYDVVPNPLIAVEQPVVDHLLAGLPGIETAIDVSTGTGRLALRLAKQGVTVVGFDPSREMLEVARLTADTAGLTNVTFIQTSLDSPLPAPSEQADLVTCALALCHVPDLNAAVQECARLLRPGGHLLLTDFHPAAIAWGWRTAFVEPGVYYELPNPGHSRADYLFAVEDAGCSVVDMQDIALGGEAYGDSSPEAVKERGLPPLCLTILARKDDS